MIGTHEGSKTEYNDTGLWRQVITVSTQRLRSWIISRENPTEQLRLEADVKWDNKDSDILQNIKEAVYDHPLLLDDFATEILIDTPKVIALPKDAIDFPEDITDSFSAIYGEDNVFFGDVNDDTVLAYSLCNGLTSFFSRTFPGSRIHHYMEPAIQRYSSIPGTGTRLYVNIHDSRLDLWAIRKGKLILIASRIFTTPEDAAYFIFATFKAWRFNPNTDEISISGDKKKRSYLMPLLRKYINYVTLTLLPAIPRRDDYPLPLILLLKKYNER